MTEYVGLDALEAGIDVSDLEDGGFGWMDTPGRAPLRRRPGDRRHLLHQRRPRKRDGLRAQPHRGRGAVHLLLRRDDRRRVRRVREPRGREARLRPQQLREHGAAALQQVHRQARRRAVPDRLLGGRGRHVLHADAVLAVLRVGEQQPARRGHRGDHPAHQRAGRRSHRPIRRALPEQDAAGGLYPGAESRPASRARSCRSSPTCCRCSTCSCSTRKA